jgi:hypothetical protein
MHRTTLPCLLALAAATAVNPTRAAEFHLLPTGGNCPIVSQVANFNVPKVSISGNFQVNGAAPLWLASHSGEIELSSATHGTVSLGLLHQQSYQRQVIPGIYDVVYRHLSGSLAPANSRTVIAEGVLIDGGNHDFSVPAVIVNGNITLAGATPPTGIYENGELYFRDPQTGSEFRVGVSKSGSYTVLVVPGDYQIVWKRLLGGAEVPLNRDIVIATTNIQANASVDIDIPRIERSGAFTINGVAPPAGIYENARISLREVNSGDLITLGETRHGHYSVRVAPGVYDIIYSKMLGGVEVPANSAAVIAAAVPMLESGSLAINIPTIDIEGSFSLDGVHFPNGIYNNARITLERDGGDRVVLGQTKAGSYTARVIPASYDVYYERLLSTGEVPVNSRARIEQGRQILPARGVREVNIAVVSGQIDLSSSYWGGPAMAGIYQNGRMHGRSSASEAFDIGTTQPGLHSVRVLADTYQLGYTHMLGEFMPANGDALLSSVAVLPGAIAGVNIDLRPGLLSGTYSQAGAHFPVFGQSARFALRDRLSGDLIELPPSTVGGYSTQLLAGTYDVIYQHVGGHALPANRGATIGCLKFMPVMP